MTATAEELTDFIGDFTTELRRTADRTYALTSLGYATAVTLVHDSDHPDLAELDHRGVTITGRGVDRWMAAIDIVAEACSRAENMPLEAAQARIHTAWRRGRESRTLWEAVAAGTVSRYQARTIENHAARFSDRVATVKEVVDADGVVTDLIADEGERLFEGEDYLRVLDQFLTAAVTFAQEGFTGRKLAYRLTRKVRQLTPGYELVALQKTDDKRGILLTPCEDGLTAHVTLLMPLDVALRLQAWGNAAADAAADAAHRAGVSDERSHGERVTDAAVDLIRHGIGEPVPARSDATRSAEPAGENAPALTGRTHKPATSVQVHVRGDAATLLGLDDETCTLDGYGPIPAHTARELATSTGAMWRKIVLSEGTRDVIDVGAHAYPINAALRRFVTARDEYCTAPGCQVPALDCDLDHIVPYPQGPTTAANLRALCRGHHRFKTQYVFEEQRAQRARRAARNPGSSEAWPGLPDEPPF